MRYHLDTIPVWDAFGNERRMPPVRHKAKRRSHICAKLSGRLRHGADVRLEVNQKGFCARHFAQMLSLNNRLGLALITHTHMQQATGKRQAPAPRAGLFSRRSVPAQEAESCILCDRLNATMDRYLYTVLHLFGTDESFRETFSASKGFCMPHARALADMAAQALPTKKRRRFPTRWMRCKKRTSNGWNRSCFGLHRSLTFATRTSPGATARTHPNAPFLSCAADFNARKGHGEAFFCPNALTGG